MRTFRRRASSANWLRRISTPLILSVMLLALCVPAFAQVQGGFLGTSEVLAVIEVPDPTPRVHTVRLASSSNETREATFVVQNVTNQRYEYDVTETLSQGGFEWLRVLSYSGVVEARNDIRNSGRDVVEFLTFCPTDPIAIFGTTSVVGEMIVRVNGGGASEQRVQVELSCAPRTSFSIPMIPGPMGPAGPAGPAGANGAPGPAGPAGPPGATGPAGVSCFDLNRNGVGDANEDRNGDGRVDALDCAGAPGAPGRNGAAGPVGPMGPAGPVGAPGANGGPGPMGPMGPAGPVGAPGANGLNGADGAPGANGGPGPMGPMGPAGPVGAPGANGGPGPMGPMGPVGAPGPVGPVGPAGANGGPGPMGPAGANGTNGAPGPVGPMGPAGPQGPTGLIEEPYASFVRSFYDFCALYSSPNQSAYTASLERELESLRAQLAQYQSCTVTCN